MTHGEREEWVDQRNQGVHHNSGTKITSLVTVLAITGRRDDGRPEISAILVPAGTAGLSAGREYDQDRLARLGHQGDRARLVRVPAENLLGPRGRGYGQFLQILDGGRGSRSPRWPPAWPRAASTSALRYVGERSAFGHELRHYQSIQFKIADMTTRAHTARLAWYDAAARMVAGQPFKQQAAMAKLVASNAAMDKARDATQIFGGYGFMNEFPVARFYRDAKVAWRSARGPPR